MSREESRKYATTKERIYLSYQWPQGLHWSIRRSRSTLERTQRLGEIVFGISRTLEQSDPRTWRRRIYEVNSVGRSYRGVERYGGALHPDVWYTRSQWLQRAARWELFPRKTGFVKVHPEVRRWFRRQEARSSRPVLRVDGLGSPDQVREGERLPREHRRVRHGRASRYPQTS